MDLKLRVIPRKGKMQQKTTYLAVIYTAVYVLNLYKLNLMNNCAPINYLLEFSFILKISFFLTKAALVYRTA